MGEKGQPYSNDHGLRLCDRYPGIDFLFGDRPNVALAGQKNRMEDPSPTTSLSDHTSTRVPTVRMHILYPCRIKSQYSRPCDDPIRGSRLEYGDVTCHPTRSVRSGPIGFSPREAVPVALPSCHLISKCWQPQSSSAYHKVQSTSQCHVLYQVCISGVCGEMTALMFHALSSTGVR